MWVAKPFSGFLFFFLLAKTPGLDFCLYKHFVYVCFCVCLLFVSMLPVYVYVACLFICFYLCSYLPSYVCMFEYVYVFVRCVLMWPSGEI